MQAGALRSTAARAGTLVAAGAAGAGIAVGIAFVTGGLSTSTTTIREVVSSEGPSSSPSSSFARSTRPLSIREIYAAAAPGVVQVTAMSRIAARPDPLLYPFGSAGARATHEVLGSGFVIDKAGHIVTNYHVVKGVSTVDVSFSDNERLPARVVGRDPSTDVAVLQVKTRPRALTPLRLGNSDTVQVGDPVVAIGDPLGEDRSITAGIVSALQRRIVSPDGAPIEGAIQTDVRLGAGSSGGPLLNARGEVIGVDSRIQAGGSGGAGVGFAIPIDTVKNVAAQLIARGVVVHPYLGVQTRAIEPNVARLFHLPVSRGLLVGAVCRDSGAAKVDLRGATKRVTLAGDTWPLGGDIIVKVDGVDVASVEALRSLVDERRPGESMQLEIYRGTKTMTVNVKLGRQPLSPRC